MKNSSIYYSVGALLYCPANRETIAASIIGQQFGRRFSLALCLEDTIGDAHVEESERCLKASVCQIRHTMEHAAFYVPKIFIRVRCPKQIGRIIRLLGEDEALITGFIIPKFSPENADAYIQQVITANEQLARTLYLMPIYESACLIDLRSRYDVLYTLKEKLSHVEELVLNIRVGGNDLCHLFSFRRHVDESIHRIRPVADIFSDILTVYGMDYVVSGAVWEYYSGSGWKEGLISELADDKLCGFTGKTVIHPNQIPVVNNAYAVTQKDYDDAQNILQWDSHSPFAVCASSTRERMNEQKTHANWAKKIVFLANTYGIRQP